MKLTDFLVVVLQKEDPTQENPDEDDEDTDYDGETPTGGHPHRNLFSSATDAVISMVKRAAEALGNKVDNQTSGVKVNDTVSTKSLCSSPRHIVVCNNCNETLFTQIYDLLSCKTSYIQKLVSIPAIYKALINSFSCRSFGLDFQTNFSFENSYIDNLQSFFSQKYVGAMCNEIALTQNQGSLNITQQYLNITKKLTKDKIISLDVTSPELPLDVLNNTLHDDHTKTENASLKVNSTELEEPSFVEQIKPTKALNSDPKLAQTLNGSLNHEPTELDQSVPKPVEESEVSTVNLMENTTNTISPAPETVMVTESSESLEDHIDHMISSDMNVDSHGAVPPSSTTANLPQAPKESIFLRLSNRIKVSGQYYNTIVVVFLCTAEDF